MGFSNTRTVGQLSLISMDEISGIDTLPVQPPSTEVLWRDYWRSRDPQPRAQLIDCYLGFARMWAARIYTLRANNAVAFDDYLQYARTGLLEAIDRFDPTRGVSFESFATARIRGSVLNGLESETELGAQLKYRGVLNIAERLESLRATVNHRNNSETLEGLAHTVVAVAMGLLLDRGEGEQVADENVNANPYASIELLYLRRKLLCGVRQLPQREADVIRMHYFEHREFQVIAEELKISKGRVSQLHARALLRLKQLLHSSGTAHAEL